jgi:hypothetical protein
MVPDWIPRWCAALRAYSQYVQPSLPVLALGKQFGLATTVIVGLLLIATLWRYRERDLAFQVALCATGFYLITQFVLWNSVLLLIPSVWIADNSRFISRCGTGSQVALSIVRVAFAALWLSTPLSAVLLHTNPLGVRLGWILPTAMLFPLFASILALMVMQSASLPLRNDLNGLAEVSGLSDEAERAVAPDSDAGWQRI